MIPNGDPQYGFFYPTLTLMMDSYIVNREGVHLIESFCLLQEREGIDSGLYTIKWFLQCFLDRVSNMLLFFHFNEGKKGGKDKESIQSNTTPYLGYHMGK